MSSGLKSEGPIPRECDPGCQKNHMCHGQGCRYIGDKLIPPLMMEILIMGRYINPYYWVDEFPIPYYMELLGV